MHGYVMEIGTCRRLERIEFKPEEREEMWAKYRTETTWLFVPVDQIREKADEEVHSGT